MRPQSLLVAALALVFGGSAAVGVNSFISNRTAAGPNADSVPVVVAAMDLPRGGMITSELITTRDFPKEMVPEGAVTKPEVAIDRAVAIHMIKGEPLLDSKLSPRGAGRGLAALVPKGMRAVTIQTPNVATGVAGFVMPGNKVDILLTVGDTGAPETPPAAAARRRCSSEWRSWPSTSGSTRRRTTRSTSRSCDRSPCS